MRLQKKALGSPSRTPPYLCPKWGGRGTQTLVAPLTLLSPAWKPQLTLPLSVACVLGTVVRTVPHT